MYTIVKITVFKDYDPACNPFTLPNVIYFLKKLQRRELKKVEEKCLNKKLKISPFHLQNHLKVMNL